MREPVEGAFQGLRRLEWREPSRAYGAFQGLRRLQWREPSRAYGSLVRREPSRVDGAWSGGSHQRLKRVIEASREQSRPQGA